MAVYTKLKEEDINNILSNYSIGKLKSFKGIQEGIENTNYFLLVEEKKYILTIYEKRGNLDNLKIAYVGDGNNIVHSWLNLATRLSFHFTCI